MALSPFPKDHSYDAVETGELLLVNDIYFPRQAALTVNEDVGSVLTSTYLVIVVSHPVEGV